MKSVIHLIDTDTPRSEILAKTGISESQYSRIGQESGAFKRREQRLQKERERLWEIDEGQSHAELSRITGRSQFWVQTWRRRAPKEKHVGVTWRRVEDLEQEMPFCDAVNKTMLEWCP